MISELRSSRESRWCRAALAAALTTGVLPAGASAQAQAAEPGQVVAFVDVTVLPMDRQRVVAGQTVIVRDGRIAAVGPTARTAVPQGATRVDGRGKFLLPGLTEMHGHLPQQAGPLAEAVMFLYVANGVTTVRGMLGAPYQLQLREAVSRGDMVGPTLFLAGPALSGNSVLTVGAAERIVRDQKQAGYDLLKVHEGLTPHVYEAIAATAKQVGMPFAGHVSDFVGVRRALEAGQWTIDHLDNYVQSLQSDEFTPSGVSAPATGAQARGSDEQKLAAMAIATKRSQTAVVPTMALWEVLVAPEDSASLASRSELRYMPRQMVQQWTQATNGIRANMAPEARGVIAARERLLKALSDSGAVILLGTDSPQLFSVPGFSIHREMQAMVRAGLTPYQILESGTRRVAEQFRARGLGAGDFGTIEVGKRADVILLDANPLDDVRHVSRRAGVMLRGRWMPEAEIQRRLEEIAAQHRG